MTRQSRQVFEIFICPFWCVYVCVLLLVHDRFAKPVQCSFVVGQFCKICHFDQKMLKFAEILNTDDIENWDIWYSPMFTTTDPHIPQHGCTIDSFLFI